MQPALQRSVCSNAEMPTGTLRSTIVARLHNLRWRSVLQRLNVGLTHRFVNTQAFHLKNLRLSAEPSSLRFSHRQLHSTRGLPVRQISVRDLSCSLRGDSLACRHALATWLQRCSQCCSGCTHSASSTAT